jgi:hypothetical protein
MELELSTANKAREAAERQLSGAREAAKVEADKQLSELREAKETTQSELDDLLMVFGDLEEKVTKYKVS